MGKTNYIDEITDAVGKEIHPKQALKVAKNIKLLQNLAAPSAKYKQQLKDHLQNTHTIDQADIVTPHFSVFQVFGVFASFVFIMGTSYMMLDFRENSGVPIYKNIIMEESGEDRPSLPTQIETQERMPAFPTELKKEILPQTHKLESNIQEELIIEKDDVMDVIEPPVGNAGMRFESMEAENLHSENFFPQSMMMDEEGYNENEEIQHFAEICNEYGGEISEDSLYCILPTGELCREEDIHTCTQGDTSINGGNDIEIDLEELIQEYGQ